MPRDFIKVQRFDAGLCYINIDEIARFGVSHPRGAYVVCKAVEEGDEAITLIVDHTPEQIAALIDEARGETPRRSEFAQAMGHAMLGGAR